MQCGGMSQLQVIVLLPNGKRHSVKVTPNTTIFEILDQVSKKAHIRSEDYDLKHHRAILDITSTVRFAGLPQNAQLELVQIKQARVESEVTLCLQLDTGERLNGKAQPSSSLWDVLLIMAPTLTGEYENPVVIYLRREIIGKENLISTTLRSIGLTGGRAILRFLNRSLEELRTQANVSAPLERPSVAPAENIPVPDLPEKIASSMEETVKVSAPLQISSVVPIENVPVPHLLVKLTTEENMDNSKDNSQDDNVSLEVMEGNKSNCEEMRLKMNETEELPTEEESTSTGKGSVATGVKRPRTDSPSPTTPPIEQLEKVILLGERSAVAFNLDAIPPAELEDLPDDFYELTLADVRSLAAAASRTVRELLNAPMLTSQQRKLDQDGLILQKLSQHKSCVIRVRFPDRSVLQGCFKPIETINHVYDFVRSYLHDSSLHFHLYTTPPKMILDKNARLVEVDCVPSAILYLGIDKEVTPPSLYLRSSVVSQFSSNAAATHAASELLARDVRKVPFSQYEAAGTNDMASSVASTSARLEGDVREENHRLRDRVNIPSGSHDRQTGNKLPKWLKLSK